MKPQAGPVVLLLVLACSGSALRDDLGPCDAPDASVASPAEAMPGVQPEGNLNGAPEAGLPLTVFPSESDDEGLDAAVTASSGDASTVEEPVELFVDPLPVATRASQLLLTGSIESEATLELQLLSGLTEFVPVDAGRWETEVLLGPGSNNFRFTACKDAKRTTVERTVRQVGFSNIAHRGASGLAPENTLAAFRLAVEHGANDIELDVQRTRDGRAMVIHDQTTGRTADVDLVVKDTDSARLRELDVGSRFGASYSGERIPFLEEVLAWLPQGHRAWIELKSGADVAAVTAAIIQTHGLGDRVIIQSFYLPVLESFQRLAPGIPLWQIRVAAPTIAELDDLARLRVGGIILKADAVTDDLLAAAYVRNVGVVAWTIDEAAWAEVLRARFVEGVMTNRPDIINGALDAGTAPTSSP